MTSPRAALLLCAAAGLALALGSCAKGARGSAGVGEACAAQLDCANPLVCALGKCSLPTNLSACAAGARRCEGADLLQCDALGLHETLAQACDLGCEDGACVEPACNVGARRCVAKGIQLCGAGAGGAPTWLLSEPCPNGCDDATVACKVLACRPLEVRCSATTPGVIQICAADGSGFVDQACAAGARCFDGACVAQRCAPSASTCNGSVAVHCKADGSGYDSQTSCPSGCAGGACLPSVCTAGESRCSGTAVEQCRPDGSGFSLLLQCGAAGCLVSGQGRAGCAAAACQPLARRCNAQGTGLEVCAGDGSGWLAGAACTDGCAGSSCLPPPAGCVAGSLRCDGALVQSCDGTSWNTIAQCLGTCGTGGVCSGGSCAPGFPLAVPIATSCAGADCTPPADGASTLLLTLGPIVDANGNTVPDGTLVTVSATGGATILAGDGSSAAQIRTHSGLADVAFRAPPPGVSSATLTAAIQGAPACSASLTVPFAANASLAYLAEDFRRLADRDPLATTVDWRTDLGDVEALQSEFGDGLDGTLSVGAGQTWNLATTPRPCSPTGSCAPFAASVRVVGLEPAAARVEGSVAGFAPGDEALLIEPQGASAIASSAAGAWELLTVSSVGEGLVSFTTRIAGTYGASPSAPLGGERVLLQRVPHFTDVVVDTGATLTTSAWAGQLGGVLAIRASGTVTVRGAINADGLGYRGGVSPDAAHGQGGESFGGVAPVLASAARNLGGGSGGYLCGDPLHLNQLDTWYGSGGSYATAGASTCVAQGTSYGTPSLARLLFGSGSGSAEQNTHGACSTSTCPAESALGHVAASRANGVGCTGPACNDTFTFCGAEDASFAMASAANGVGCTTQSCLNTFGSCSAYSVGHGATSKPNNGGCADGTCTDTLSACSAYTGNHGAAALPCDGTNNPACQDSFNSCGNYNVGHSDSPYPGNDCATACPRLVVANTYSCFYCGCPKSNPRLCNFPTCNSVFSCDANSSGILFCYAQGCGDAGNRTTVFNRCHSGGDSCSNSNDNCNTDTVKGVTYVSQYCDPNDCTAGVNCECHYKCAQCWDGPVGAGPGSSACNGPDGATCNSCSVCTGCTTNPGCQTNPGCATNPGCQTNPGCNTCGGRLSSGADGSACDYTTPGNTCRCPLPWQRATPGAPGGGIVFIAAATLDLSAVARVSARGLSAIDPQGGAATTGGGAGGSLWLRIGNLKMVAGAVLSASGGAGGGDGRVRLERAGGVDPVASGQIAPAPYVVGFALPTMQTVPLLPAALVSKRVVSAALVAAIDSSPQSYAVSANGGATWLPIGPGGSAAAFAATGDVRFRALLMPQGGAAARIHGLVWVLQLQ